MGSHSPYGRTGRRRGLGILALALVVVVLLSLGASSATGTSQSTSQAAFRQQFTAYLVQMQQVATIYQATPQGRAAFAGMRYKPSTAMARAREAVRQMTPAQLAVLQRSLSVYPAWRTIPVRLRTLVVRVGHKTPPRSGLITPDNCATARGFGYTQTDVEIAADAALAADAILEAVPSDLLSEVVRIAAVLIWAVPQGFLRGFEHSYNIASACDDADHQALVQQNLDVKVSTRATQSSLDSLTTNFNALSTLINARLDVAVSTRATQTSVNTLLTNVNNLQTSVTTFHNEFTANAIVVNTKLDSANTKLDNLAITVSDQGALNLRIHIEDDLADPGNHPLALFEVPEANGGYLDLVRSIVADTIAKMQATGQGVGNAQSFVAAGDAAVAAHDYKTAYADYGKAYRAAAA
jgi:hypothetical protein